MVVAVCLKRAPLRVYETGLVFFATAERDTRKESLESHVGCS